MAEQVINCDLRCDVCPNGAQWDDLAPALSGRIATVTNAITRNTDTAERALTSEAPENPDCQPMYQRLLNLGEAALALVTAEAALRSSLAGELERIGATGCDDGNACRIDALAAAGDSYSVESMGLAAIWTQKYRKI